MNSKQNSAFEEQVQTISSDEEEERFSNQVSVLSRASLSKDNAKRNPNAEQKDNTTMKVSTALDDNTTEKSKSRKRKHNKIIDSSSPKKVKNSDCNIKQSFKNNVLEIKNVKNKITNVVAGPLHVKLDSKKKIAAAVKLKGTVLDINKNAIKNKNNILEVKQNCFKVIEQNKKNSCIKNIGTLKTSALSRTKTVDKNITSNPLQVESTKKIVSSIRVRSLESINCEYLSNEIKPFLTRLNNMNSKLIKHTENLIYEDAMFSNFAIDVFNDIVCTKNNSDKSKIIKESCTNTVNKEKEEYKEKNVKLEKIIKLRKKRMCMSLNKLCSKYSILELELKMIELVEELGKENNFSNDMVESCRSLFKELLRDINICKNVDTIPATPLSPNKTACKESKESTNRGTFLGTAVLQETRNTNNIQTINSNKGITYVYEQDKNNVMNYRGYEEPRNFNFNHDYYDWNNDLPQSRWLYYDSRNYSNFTDHGYPSQNWNQYYQSNYHETYNQNYSEPSGWINNIQGPRPFCYSYGGYNNFPVGNNNSNGSNVAVQMQNCGPAQTFDNFNQYR